MRKRYNDRNYWQLLGRPRTEFGTPEVLPRSQLGPSWQCDGSAARAAGMQPVLDRPDMIPDQDDWKEVIKECHTRKLFPMYWEERHGNHQHWNQDGLGYCWTWSATMALMDIRAMQEKPDVLLRPTSLGWLVNWRNQGFYLSRTIQAVAEKGICSAEFIDDEHSIRPSTFKSGWEEDALNYRCEEWWDGYTNSPVGVISQSLAMFRAGMPIYIAYNWWGHALCAIGMLWDESEPWNVVMVIRNSHNEKDPIELSGQRMIFDEFYAPRTAELAR